MAVQTSPAYSCCIHCLVMSSGTVTDRIARFSPRNSVLEIQLSYAASLILVRKCCLICSQQFISLSQKTATFAHVFHSLWKTDSFGSVSRGPVGLRQETSGSNTVLPCCRNVSLTQIDDPAVNSD